MPPMTNLPPGLTQDWVDQFMGDNPGATPDIAVKEYLIAKSKATGQPVERTLSQWFQQEVSGPATEGAARAWGALRPGSAQTLNDPADPMTKSVMQHLIPQTPTDAALTLAAGPVNRFVGMAGRPLLSGAMRVGASAGLGAGTAAATGDDPLQGATSGALGQGVGEATRLGQATYDLTKAVMTRRRSLKQADEGATLALNGVMQEVPALTGFVQPGSPHQELDKLRGPDGQKFMSKWFDQQDKSLVTALGGPNAIVDTNAVSIRHGLPVNPNAPKAQVTIKDALAELKLASEEARQSWKTDPGVSGKDVRANARQLETDILDAVAVRNPQAAAEYQAAREQYAKFKSLQSALDTPSVWTGKAQRGGGATFDDQALLDEMWLNNRNKMGPENLPKLYDSLLRGAQPGGRNVTANIGNERVYAGGLSGRVPSIPIQVERRGAVQIGSPRFALPTIGTLMGEAATRPTQQPGSYVIE